MGAKLRRRQLESTVEEEKRLYYRLAVLVNIKKGVIRFLVA